MERDIELERGVELRINKTDLIRVNEEANYIVVQSRNRAMVFDSWENFVGALDMRNAVYANKYEATKPKQKRATMKINC